MTVRLIMERDGREYELPQGQSTLGRRASDICVPHGSISKQHALFTVDGHEVHVEDLGSRNGTFVGGLACERSRLANGDVILCGKVRFRIDGIPEAPSELGPRLRLVSGASVEVFPLGPGKTTLGARRGNDVVLCGDGISRYHAEITCQDGVYAVRDLGSRNGVKVRSKPIESHTLVPGDVIQIGTCELLFEVARPSAFAVVSQTVAALREDPVGALRSNRRIQLGLASVAAALALCAVLLMPDSGALSDLRSTRRNGPWLAEGSEHLVSGRYEQAKEVFRRAKVQVRGETATPETLEDIAVLWVDLEGDPTRFRWSKAEGLLKQAARLSGLDPELRAWLDEQDALVSAGAQDFASYQEAVGHGDRGAALGEDVDEALEAYAQALGRAGAIDEQGPLAAPAQALRSRARRAAFGLAGKDAVRLAKAADWSGALARAERARAFAGDAKDRNKLRRLEEACRQNQRDDGCFVRAQQLIRRQDPRGYPEARRLLATIDEDSRVSPDAKAYLAWLDADAHVRAAQEAYDRADVATALRLLDEAKASPSLGAEARESIARRRAHWRRVATAFERGIEASRQSQDEVAVEELDRVLALECSDRNRYRFRALKELDHLRARRRSALEARLREGLGHLKGSRIAQALEAFEAVRRDPALRDEDLGRIQEAVALHESRAELLRHSKRDLIRDRRESFLGLRDNFLLLATWLPEGHPHRAPARKHLDAVAGRLESWRNAGNARPRATVRGG